MMLNWKGSFTMANISFYSLKLVKEKGARYDADTKVNTPENIYNMMVNLLSVNELPEEHVYLICLDTKMKLTAISEISHGGLNQSIVEPGAIFKRALLANAKGFVIMHNHPSGNTDPSNEDDQITQRLAECGNLLGIQLIDHIIAGDDFYSYRQKGKLL